MAGTSPAMTKKRIENARVHFRSDSQDEVLLNPHGEERGKAARLEPRGHGRAIRIRPNRKCSNLDADRERCGCRGRLCLARNHLADDVVWVMVAVTPALQRRRHFVEADRLAAILVQLAENVVGLRDIATAGANDAFKFRFADLAIMVSIHLREQVLQRVRTASEGRRG